MSLQNKKRILKVSLAGETKRLANTNSYESLVKQTRDKFSGQGLESVKHIKFYYLDDENELISISSQSDFLEALSIEDVTTLRLIVAENANEARQDLEKQIGDNISLSQSINHGAPLMSSSSRSNFPRLDTMISDFNIDLNDRAETDRLSQQKSNESNFMDTMKSMFQKTFTDAFSEVQSIVTPRKTEESLKVEEPLKMPEVPSEITQINTKLSANIPASTIQKKEKTCADNHVQCSKCKGTLKKPDGKDCGFCKGTGHFCYNGLDQQVADARAEIKEICAGGLKQCFADSARGAGQSSVVHKGFICDGCEADPIVGIMYKCTQCDDYDICQKCEANGVHNEHTMLKIRKPEHTPASISCKYASDFTNGVQAQYPQMHFDQSIDKGMAENMQKMVGMFMPQSMDKQPDMATTIKNLVDKFIPQVTQEKPELDCTIQNLVNMFVPLTQQAQPEATDLKMPEVPEVFAPAKIEEPVITEAPIAIQVSAEVVEPVVIADEFKLQPMTTQPIIEEPLSKEEIYNLESSAETGYLREGLMQLAELGFIEFNRNKELLQKFKMNVQAAASALLEDMELYD